jgi:hypothetical protein
MIRKSDEVRSGAGAIGVPRLRVSRAASAASTRGRSGGRGGLDRVEEKTEGGQRLSTMLDRETKQDDAPFADARL